MTKKFPKAKLNLKARSEKDKMSTDVSVLGWEPSCKTREFLRPALPKGWLAFQWWDGELYESQDTQAP